MFHDLVRQTLVVNPELRPDCSQLQQHLGEVAIQRGWDLEERIDFELQRQRTQQPEVAKGGIMTNLHIYPMLKS